MKDEKSNKVDITAIDEISNKVDITAVDANDFFKYPAVGVGSAKIAGPINPFKASNTIRGWANTQATARPTQAEILSITTKLYDFYAPVFVTPPDNKVYTILGKTPVQRAPEIKSNDIQIHILRDPEICYCVNNTAPEEELFFSESKYPELSPGTIFVICGKKFGKRKLDALASILLKINAPNIIVQKYARDKSNRNTLWVLEYNKQISKLEKHIHEILRSNG